MTGRALRPRTVPPAVRDRLTVVAARGALPDVGAARHAIDRACAVRGLRGDLVVASDDAHLSALVAAADDELVLVMPDATGLDDLHLPGRASVVRVDLAVRPRDRCPRVRRHIRGRGLDGLRYAVDTWFFGRTSPATVHRYGTDPDQHADLRLPADPPGPDGFPVAVLVHGGYWHSWWEADLMEPVAADLLARGTATWNVEYRRPDDHTWDATTSDVAAALDALADVEADLDLSRVVVLGHSAGGQLAVRLAADVAADAAARVRPALTVSLAGVLDLAEGDRRRLGGGAVSQALGGRAHEVPDVYRASSPMERLPIGSPLAVVCGHDDDPDLLATSRGFAAAARAAGDDVVVHEGPGDHFAVVDPGSALWRAVVGLIPSR